MNVRSRDGELLVGVGDSFSWDTLGGNHYEGTIIEMDSNVAIVRCSDGVERPVEL